MTSMERISPAQASTADAEARDYVALLKPRVMSLVIFTALVGLLAAPGEVHAVTGFAAILAIAVGAGAAGALNMWWDADIDAQMRRTRRRPIPAGRVPRAEAAGFGAALAVLSVVTMNLAAGWKPAALLAFTIFFYVVVYSMGLKRRTPQNIVIGGLAGALPPAIGWSVAGDVLHPAPWALVALIFLWTPPHFWALSLYKAGDYARAGVPMLPVVRGSRVTRRHIFAYVALLGPATFAPIFAGIGGMLYGVVGGAAYAGLLVLGLRVLRGADVDEPRRAGLYETQDRAARDLFAFSILYLFALFAALFVEALGR